MKTAALLAALLALPAVAEPSTADAAAPTQDGPELKMVRRSRPLFGAVVEGLAAVKTDDAARAAAGHLEAAFAEMERVAGVFDEASPASPIAQVVASAGSGGKVVVDPETFAVLEGVLRVAKLSRGALDPTAAAYADLWRFDDDGDAGAALAPPTREQLQARRPLVGYQDLVLDPAARSVQLRRPGAKLSLAAYAKAFALDRAATVLEARGVTDFLVTAGGDLVVRGTKGGKPWMVGVQDPRAAGHFAALPAKGGAVATVGDYERFFFDGKARLHDVLDPKTGMPATKARSVTVAAPDAVSAEALARAVFVLGAKDGVALLERMKGVDAVVVTADNRVVTTRGLKGTLQHRPPTDAP